jgi:hypothetical protein
MVICKKCERDLPETAFSRNKRTKTGLCIWCKECSAAYQKAYRKRNKEALAHKQRERHQKHREENIARACAWYQEHKDRKKAYDKEYLEVNRDKIRRRRKRYYKANKDHIKKANAAYLKRRLKTDETFAIVCRLRHRLYMAFQRYSKNGKVGRSKDYGIDWQAIFEHIGPCPGPLSDYHIDHIIPLSMFDHDDPEQVRQAWAPENHQWLSATENLRKHAKLDYSKAVISKGE